MIQFDFLSLKNADSTLPVLFNILHSNMNEIAPTGNSYSEDEKIWLENVRPALNKPQRRIVLIRDDCQIIGYFQYYINQEKFMMEEIQLIHEYQGTGVFSAFYRWLMPQLPDDITFVEAYSHINNKKSQQILEHLGLEICKDGTSSNHFHYKGNYQKLKDKYAK